MTSFYTNVQSFGNYILYRGVVDGKRVKSKIKYNPSLYTKSKNIVTPFTSLEGDYLERKMFGGVQEARDFIKQFKDVSGAPKIYGNANFEYAYIADVHKGAIEWDINKISSAVIDIEAGSENGFPDPYDAIESITAITIAYINGPTFVFGCGDYQTQGTETYIKCKDEHTLCKRFLELWIKKYPDIVTGWNTKFFDIPYLVNRFRKILGEEETKKLSPWSYIAQRNTFMMNKTMVVYELSGVSSLDYLELYKWFAKGGKSRDSYKLNNITSIELGETKISYDEYDSLHELYRMNFQKFIEYNIKDVSLILRMEDKLKLLELAITMAYVTKSNFDDVFTQTRMWDSLVYSYLLNKNIIVPPKVVGDKTSMFAGAYVKEPQVGRHNWVASLDLDSLYPHLMMQYNISPETLVRPENYTQEMYDITDTDLVSVETLLNKTIDTSKLKGQGVTLTPNKQFFRTDIRGFLPQMLEDMYTARKRYKQFQLQAEQELEQETDKNKKVEIENRIARYNNLQLAMKVTLNSAYGALGSAYFRFYDLRMAVAVTSAGQLSIRWIENKINEYMNDLLKTDAVDYVIASDTDSIYLNLGPLVNKVYGDKTHTGKTINFIDRVCKDKILPHIDEKYQELSEYVCAYSQSMFMKREALADKGIWTAKKRYILNIWNNEGVQYNEPHMKVTGLEMIKSSTPSAIREKMSEAIKLMLAGTENDVQNFIEKFRKEFKSLPPEDISFPRGLNGLSKYSDTVGYKLGTPIHVKGAILYNQKLEELNLSKKYPYIQEGEKVKFTYLKTPNPLRNAVISFPVRLPKEFGLHGYIDYDMQFQKAFIDPIKIILDCMGWKTEKLDTLESFFA